MNHLEEAKKIVPYWEKVEEITKANQKKFTSIWKGAVGSHCLPILQVMAIMIWAEIC